MLVKPGSCAGCALATMGEGFMAPSLAGEDRYRVALIGEALGEQEVENGRPFVGRAGGKLTQLIQYAGLDRGLFDIFNVAWCRPPSNLMEGQPYEHAAIRHCREAHWDHLLSRSNVLVPMGNVPLGALTGRKGILKTRGYFRPGPGNTHVLPTVHPSFIMRGQSAYAFAFINDLIKAVDVARNGLPPQITNYHLDPPPGRAEALADQYLADLGNGRAKYLAFDIETPGKGDEEDDVDEETDSSWHIFRIGFAWREYEAVSIPYSPAYYPAIRKFLSSGGEKVVWNYGFDVPRLERAGTPVNGLIHDGMIAWHVLHSDMKKALGHVATFTCPHQPEWKNLSHSRPAFYNATDADVELRSMIAIEKDLRDSGLWNVYDRDVLQLDPILRYMKEKGLPIDKEVRQDRALRLTVGMGEILNSMNAVIPDSIRRYSPKEGYVRAPEDTTGMVQIEVPEVTVRRCPNCGTLNPPATHFSRKTLPLDGTTGRRKADRVDNPCYGAEAVDSCETVRRWAKPEYFKPSRQQLIGYQLALGRQVPTKWDNKEKKRKPSMDKKAIQKLINKYGDDKLYPLVLEYRDYEKIAGTYIGKVEGYVAE